MVSTTVGPGSEVSFGVVVSALGGLVVVSVLSVGSVLAALVDAGAADRTVMGAPLVRGGTCCVAASGETVSDALLTDGAGAEVDDVVLVDAQETVTATDKAAANTAAAILLDLT